MVLNDLVPYNKVWHKERQALSKKYLAQNHLTTIMQKDKLLAQAGMQRNLDKMAFFILDPYHKEHFLINIRMFYKVGQTLVFGDRNKI